MCVIEGLVLPAALRHGAHVETQHGVNRKAADVLAALSTPQEDLRLRSRHGLAVQSPRGPSWKGV